MGSNRARQLLNMVTIYESLYTKVPHHITVDDALARIKNGKSADRVKQIRSAIDKVKADGIKRSLPAVAFAGTFATRGDGHLLTHSGFMVLDFDKLYDVGEMAAKLYGFPSTYAYWLSPSGNGLKALIRIADGTKHRDHFNAIRETFPDADPSGVNEERLCFESYDPDIFINPDAKPFTGLLTVKQVFEKVDAGKDDAEKFKLLLTWIANKGEAFTSGSRNTFIFKLAGACCRFGMDIATASGLIAAEYPASNDFTHRELLTTVKSAFRSNARKAGIAAFEKGVLVDIKSRKEVKLDDIDLDPNTRPRDVVYASDVKAQALNIYNNGYASVKGIGVEELDKHFKMKRGEVTCLTGIGNYGKSAFYKWYMLMRILVLGEKFASFSPEDNPPDEYYHDFVEIYHGCDCTPANPYRPSLAQYTATYDWIGENVFYLYPVDNAPTPDYIKERFLEMIVKDKVDGVCIDPFNQMSNDYKSAGGRSDKYLEAVLGEFSRFAQANNVYFLIVAHPKSMDKNQTGNYNCPDLFDLNDGAMWNNKMDNILVYHRPFMQTNPDDPTAEFHSKKIRRQKTVGKRGMFDFRYVRATRRFEFGSIDPISDALRAKDKPTNGIAYRPDLNGYQPADSPKWEDFNEAN